MTTHEAPLRSASLAARLLTLVVVPLVAMAVLAVQRIESEQSAATHAHDVADLVTLHQDVAAVYPYANLEQIALEGLARIDELGVPRSLVVTIAGVDLQAITTTNAALLDGALDRLDAGHRDLVLGDTVLGEELADIRRELDTQRALGARGAGRRSDVQAVFERLDGLLTSSLGAGPGALDANHSHEVDSLRSLADVLASAGHYGRSVLDAMLQAQADTRSEATRSYAVHEALLDLHGATLEPEQARRLEAVRVAGREFVADVPLAGSGSLGATDPAVITAATTALLDLFDYLSELQRYSEQLHDEVRASAIDELADAERHTAMVIGILVGITVLTALLIVAVLASILKPLRRLTARAGAISRGELDLAPLPLRGPSDLRSLTLTLNEMLGTLHRVHGEITRLAAGDVGDDTVPDLPGAIGVSMRDSVRHLATVTGRLQRSEQMSSAIVSQAADAIWTVGDDGTIRTANRASGSLTRVPPEAQIGMRIDDLLSSTEGEANVTAAFGPQPKVLVATSVIDGDDGRITVVIAHDISERARFEERLEYQANHDAVTGLPNRFAVLDHLGRLLAEGRSVAVLFIDLDAFKSVNDTHGHAVGDRVLADVGRVLARSTRNTEFVGRLGGDEFVVVMSDIAQPTDAVALGYRIIRELEQPQEHDGNMFVLSASVGVAFPDRTVSAIDAIRQADSAVYQAKRRGRGRVERFDAAMQEQIEHQAAVELALRQAVRNDELRIHLQPVFDLRSDRILGAEALVRWERPGHGMVPPDEFIPIAERTSLIFEVERWVLTQACARVAAWRRRDPACDHRIAVNISGRHLIEGDLLNDVEASLALTGADPHMLELELTETQLLEDLERATAVLDALRSRGITIAVDDFGTGYSSMTYLRHLPIDTVKIDRSFVARATEHGYDSTVIEALLTIAKTLELTVVAEGIETDDQLAYVRSRGCDRAQGYLLARPMPVESAEELMCAATADAACDVSVVAPRPVSA